MKLLECYVDTKMIGELTWLGLSTISRLLAVVSALSLGEQRSFTGFVLGDLVLCVLFAVLALAVRASVACVSASYRGVVAGGGKYL